MNKRKLFAFLTVISLILPLAGCFNKIPELTEEEETKVVRYMADAVLEHDVNYQARLLSEEEKQKALEEEARKEEELKKIVEQEKVEKEEKKAENTPDEVTTSYASKSYEVDYINDYLGLDNIEFELVSEETSPKYPISSGDLGFAFTASDNNKLLVLKFRITNVSSDSAELNLSQKNVKYKAYINDDIKASSVMVPLDGVLNVFHETIESGTSKEGDLIFEIPGDVSVESIILSVSASGSDTVRIKIK